MKLFLEKRREVKNISNIFRTPSETTNLIEEHNLREMELT